MQTFVIPRNAETRPFHKHWQFCVGSCHAPLLLRRDYIQQLKAVHDDLGIQRVRCHGIFGDEMHTYDTLADALGNDQVPELYYRNFRLPILAYENVLAAGMQPFVELSFMPQHLAMDPTKRGSFYYKPCISMPKSDEAWCDHIQAFVRALLDHFGTEEVRNWYFEVWNEPDLTTPFFAGTQQDYFHLYEITARAVKAVDPALRVGGPSTSASKWVESFVAFCREKDVPLDFVTTHQYPGDPITSVYDQGALNAEGLSETEREQMARYANIDLAALFSGLVPEEGILPFYRRILQDTTETGDYDRAVLAKHGAIVKQQACGLPVYYTEWSDSATCPSDGHDTRRMAAYDVFAALAADGILDGSSIWCLSDTFEENLPYPEEFHGGFGLQTQHGIPKPAYRAMELLGRAGDQRLVLDGALDGEISLAAFRKGADTQLVLTRQTLHHQQNKDAPAETAHIRVELPAAPRAVVAWRIDEDHCNPARAWQEMGRPMHPTPAQLELLRQASELRPEFWPVTYENGVLTLETVLGTNDLCFIWIQE